MPHKTVLTVAVLAAATLVSAFAAEPVLEFKVNKAAPRTAGMCGPTHDEEVIFGLGSDGKQHYFAVGTDVRGSGITIWQSEDMVNWKDVGRVFTQTNKPAILESGGRGFAYTFRNVEIGDDGAYKLLDTPAPGNNRLGNAFWAPCIYYHVYDQTYYLYYCCSAFGVRNSFIGCAKSKTLDKGWTDCGVLIHTRVGDGKRFNAIDPAVIHNDFHTWMVYGSYFGGIALVELDPKDPSKLLHPGTHGKTIASRTTDTVFDISTLEKAKAAPKNDPTAGQGIEGASILYHRYLFDGYYYLFVSYDNLEWSYNCRVGRSKNIEGPYLDYNGKPLIYDQRKLGEDTVYGTKIIGPYRWKSTGTGWAGTGHTTVFGEGSMIMFGSNSKWEGSRGSYLGLRRVFWSKDGWPLLSPCIYGGEDLAIRSGVKVVDGKTTWSKNIVEKDGILNSGE
ncbi:MAG: arabinan endo-1,5-alpha-L-arabinosidase, partial [Lentisphaeria bacterium]|nr:arabinan endo-1,5-alpha-L-arabinosidase [Lentisphaeria bacterium]